MTLDVISDKIKRATYYLHQHLTIAIVEMANGFFVVGKAAPADPRNFDALYDLTTELARAGRLDEARRYGQDYLSRAPRARYGAEIAEIQRLLAGGNIPGR